MWRKTSNVCYREIKQISLLRWLKTLHVDTVRKKRVGWSPSYLKNGSENRTESFSLEGRKVALVIDNCTTHLNIESLKSITLFFLPPNTTSYLQPMDQGVIQLLKCKYRSHIIKTIINAIDNGKQMPSISILEPMKILPHSWIEVSESTIINSFHNVGLRKVCQMKMIFSAFKSSIDELWQRDENLIANDFTYKDILTVDNDIAVMRGVMTDEEIVQDLIEVAEEEVQEEDKEVANKMITKPTTEEIRKAIDTLVDFSMFTQTGEIGTIVLKAAKLFKKELWKSIKQTFISDFFLRKNDFLARRFYIGFYMYLYFYNDSKYEMWMRFLKCFIYFQNLVKSDVFKNFSIHLEGPS